MTFLVLGVSHNSAPISVLDQLALTKERAAGLSFSLVADDAFTEAVVLATCNRIEIYADVPRFHPAVSAGVAQLATATGVDPIAIEQYSYAHFEDAAVAHLFSVTAGLDSMVLGETQILGQTRSAFILGQESGTAGRALNGVFQRALRVSKSVHSRTGIDSSGASVVSVALDTAAEVVGPLPGMRVLVVGAGSMGALTVSTLTARDVHGLVVANRSPGTAARLAGSAATGRAVGLEDLDQELALADIAVFCIGAAGTVLDANRLTRIERTNPGPLVVLDLALPHDTDPEIGHLPGVVRIDLGAVAMHSLSASAMGEIEHARAIVAESVGEFLLDQKAAEVEPTVVALRAHAAEVVDAEIARLRLRLSALDPSLLGDVERSMRRAMNTLLHDPTVRLKELASGADGERFAGVLAALFNLELGPFDLVNSETQDISFADLREIQLAEVEAPR